MYFLASSKSYLTREIRLAELTSVLTDLVKPENCTKDNLLQLRLFSVLCHAIETEHKS